MKKEMLELLAKVAGNAAKRADGCHGPDCQHADQPKKPEKRQ